MSRMPRLEPNITWFLGASVMSVSTSAALHMVTFCTGPPLFHVEHTRAPFIPEWLQVPWGLGCAPLHPPAAGPPPRKPWPQDRGQTPSPRPLLTRHPRKQPQGFSSSQCPLPRPSKASTQPCRHVSQPHPPLSRLHICSEAGPVSSLCQSHHVVTCSHGRTFPPAGAFQVPGLSSLTSACSLMSSFSQSVASPGGSQDWELGQPCTGGLQPGGPACHSGCWAQRGCRSRPAGPAASLPSCCVCPPGVQ